MLQDETTGLLLPESTTIIEYLDGLAPGGPRLVPADGAATLQARLWDRFCDQQVALPMQKIVTDNLRPAGRNDPAGVEAARAYREIFPMSWPDDVDALASGVPG